MNLVGYAHTHNSTYNLLFQEYNGCYRVVTVTNVLGLRDLLLHGADGIVAIDNADMGKLTGLSTQMWLDRHELNPNGTTILLGADQLKPIAKAQDMSITYGRNLNLGVFNGQAQLDFDKAAQVYFVTCEYKLVKIKHNNERVLAHLPL